MACELNPGISRPIDAFIKYFLDVKPYHTKLLEVIEKYIIKENLEVEFSDSLFKTIKIRNRPLCNLTGFGLVWDSECGFDALSCCDLFDCIDAGYGLIFDNSDLLVSADIISIDGDASTIIISGNHLYDTKVNIKNIIDATSFSVSGNWLDYFTTHNVFIVAPYNIFNIIGNTTTEIIISGNHVDLLLQKHEINLLNCDTFDRKYPVISATYDSINNQTSIRVVMDEDLPSDTFAGYIEVATGTKNNGPYQVSTVSYDGTDTIVNINSARPFTYLNELTNGMVKFRTSLFAREIFIEGEIEQNNGDWFVIDATYNSNTDQTTLLIDGFLRSNDTDADPGTVNLYGYMSTPGFDGDELCSSPKAENVHVNISELLSIIIHDYAVVTPTPTPTITPTISITPTATPTPTVTPTATVTPTPSPTPVVDELFGLMYGRDVDNEEFNTYKFNYADGTYDAGFPTNTTPLVKYVYYQPVTIGDYIVDYYRDGGSGLYLYNADIDAGITFLHDYVLPVDVDNSSLTTDGTYIYLALNSLTSTNLDPIDIYAFSIVADELVPVGSVYTVTPNLYPVSLPEVASQTFSLVYDSQTNRLLLTVGVYVVDNDIDQNTIASEIECAALSFNGSVFTQHQTEVITTDDILVNFDNSNNRGYQILTFNSTIMYGASDYSGVEDNFIVITYDISTGFDYYLTNIASIVSNFGTKDALIYDNYTGLHHMTYIEPIDGYRKLVCVEANPLGTTVDLNSTIDITSNEYYASWAYNNFLLSGADTFKLEAGTYTQLASNPSVEASGDIISFVQNVIF